MNLTVKKDLYRWLVLLLISYGLFFALACGANRPHPSDTVAKYVVPGTEIYFRALDMTQAAHRILKPGTDQNIYGCTGLVGTPEHKHGAGWVAASKVKLEADPILKNVWATWIEIANLDTTGPVDYSEYVQVVNQLWQIAQKLLAFLPDSTEKQNLIDEMKQGVQVPQE